MQQNTDQMKKGLKFERQNTKDGIAPFDQFKYELRTSAIKNPNGDVVFEMKDVEVPAAWSQVATDILAQKYFRRAGVPQADGSLGAETSVKQVAHRLADCWRTWGEKYGYFASNQDAQVFYDELVYSIIGQQSAPNSPQWFNTGLHSTYGITGKPQGHYYVDPETEKLNRSTSAYERPQPHACFILSVDDDLVNEGGIMDLWVREARIFKYGSGVGTNFSKVRGNGEKLSGGGTSSGIMSFLKIGDRAAGAIKSGGTTRRAAKMVCLDLDHPEIMSFINWKKNEELKVAALIAAGYASDYEGEAYATVSGQNSNNSVRIPNKFFEALKQDGNWDLIGRADGKVFKTLPAKEVWDAIGDAAWACADPGVQYDDTINEWHTCPEGGRINASNPCSEYMFLDNTACNLASLNLMKFFDAEKLEFDIVSYEYAIRLWTVVLEVSVLMAQFPSQEVAQLSYDYRTLGLGYANLGTLLMVSGIPYDSPKSFAICGALTSILTGQAYATSAEMAAAKGTFRMYDKNKKHMMRVMRNHRYAAYNTPLAFEGLSIPSVSIDPQYCPEDLLKSACNAWDKALSLGDKFGYRNAQTTVIAPTGTIGLVMDCDTTGIEPDFALVKFKKLSGGGYFKIINQAVPAALKTLGYTVEESNTIVNYAKGHATLEGCPFINSETLKAKGFAEADITNIEAQLLRAFDIDFVFNVFTLGEETIEKLGFKAAQYKEVDFNLLRALGFKASEIEAANEYVTGTMTIEGAPFLKEEHYPVFDTANKCGNKGTRFLHAHSHIKMMAAAQPFISGAISKTINLPNEATVEDIKSCYEMSWSLGLKANAIYRDGSKLSQPLSNKSDKKEEKEETVSDVVEAVERAVGINATTRVEDLTPEIVLEAARLIINSNNPAFKQQLSNIATRKVLPNKRKGFTQKSKIDGNTIFVRTGEYEDGTLGEIFVDMHKEGASFRSLMNCFAIAVSIGLQYGVPLEEYYEKFSFSRFEPSGMVEGHANIKSSTSVVDFIFRLLGFEYLNRQDQLHIKPKIADEMPIVADYNLAQNEIKQPVLADAVKPAVTSHVVKRAAAATPPTMGDAPACKSCGNITMRSGTCYTCLTCGTTSGCS